MMSEGANWGLVSAQHNEGGPSHARDASGAAQSSLATNTIKQQLLALCSFCAHVDIQ
jgi:hypothetical protein